MSRFLTIFTAGSAHALVSIAVPRAADARWGRGAAVVGGIAAGAIIAGAASNAYYGRGYAYDSGYADGGTYPVGAPYYGAYGYYGGGTACDRTSYDRQLQGSGSC